MRRTLSGLVAVLVAGLLVAGGVTPAYAAEPLPPPVTPIPELPSNTIRMTPTASGSWTATDWWRAAIWKAGQPGTELATLPNGVKTPVVAKPITPAVTMARGAAGGPLVAAFTGGFAIGQFGLSLWGGITGTDPLDGICGSPFEGAGHILYMGMMPECNAVVEQPNEDVLAGFSPLIFANGELAWVGVDRHGNGNPCYQASGPGLTHGTQLVPPAGFTPGYFTTAGAFIGAAPSYGVNSPCVAPSNMRGWVAKSEIWEDMPVLVLRNATTGEIRAMEEVSGDPVRTPSCRIGWEDGTTTTGTGTPYRESEGFPLSSAGLGCESAYVSKPGAGPDLLPSTIDVESEAESGAITEIAQTAVPPMTQPQRQALTVPSNGRGLVLSKVVNGSLQSCMTWEADCANWWDTSDSGANDSTYRCTYGGNKVPLAECGPYRNTFQEATSTPTITDPVTSEPQPWPSEGTSPSPGTSTQTGGGGCALAWSWNPVDWVLNPLKCAFIPSTATVDGAFSSLENRWQSTAIGGMTAAVTAWSFVPPSSSGCDGITVGISQLGHDIEDFQILNACPGEPLQGVAALSTLVIGIGAVLTAIAAVTGSIGGIVGQRPLAAGPAS